MSSKSTMSNKSSSATKSGNSSTFSRRSKVAASRHLTSEIIASDIAAFKQRGGRIEVLGNTSRSRLASTAFHSDVKSKRKVTAAAATKDATGG